MGRVCRRRAPVPCSSCWDTCNDGKRKRPDHTRDAGSNVAVVRRTAVDEIKPGAHEVRRRVRAVATDRCRPGRVRSMSDATPAEVIGLHRRALLTGVTRALGLLRRVPELLKRRGVDFPDQDLIYVLCAAIACKKAGAGKQAFRRPPNSTDDWPADKPIRTATQIIIDFDLFDLMEPA